MRQKKKKVPGPLPVVRNCGWNRTPMTPSVPYTLLGSWTGHLSPLLSSRALKAHQPILPGGPRAPGAHGLMLSGLPRRVFAGHERLRREGGNQTGRGEVDLWRRPHVLCVACSRGPLALRSLSQFSRIGSRRQDLCTHLIGHGRCVLEGGGSLQLSYTPKGCHLGQQVLPHVGSGRPVSMSTKGLVPATHLGSESLGMLAAASFLPNPPLCLTPLPDTPRAPCDVALFLSLAGICPAH